MGRGNTGIQITGGNLTATNVAAGENATIRIGGGVRQSVAADLAALDALVAAAGAGQQAETALAAVAAEAAKPEPDQEATRGALDVLRDLCAAGGALAGLADKVLPLVQRIGQMLAVAA